MSSKCTCSIGLQHALNVGKEVAIHVKVDDGSSDACRKTCYQQIHKPGNSTNSGFMNSMQTLEQNVETVEACTKTTALDCTTTSPDSNGISNSMEGAITSFKNVNNKRASKFSDKGKIKGHRSSQRLLHEVMSKKLAEAQYTKEMKARRGTKALHRIPPAETNPKRKHNNLESTDQESTPNEGTLINLQFACIRLNERII